MSDHFRTVPTNAVEADERYRFTRGEPSEALRASIEAHGCFSPPLCLAEGDQLVPLAGFKRLAILRALDGELTVRVVEAASPVEAIAVAAAEIRSTRELGPFEVARAFDRARQHGVDRPTSAQRLGPALGVEPHEVVVKRHLELLRVPSGLADWLEQKGVSLKRALAFSRVRPDDAAVLLDLASRFEPSARALEEWHAMLVGISKRDGSTFAAVLGAAGEPNDSASLRDGLWRQRYLAALSLPDGASVHWDDSFEREGCELRLPIKTADALRSDLTGLSDEAQIALFDALLDAL